MKVIIQFNGKRCCSDNQQTPSYCVKQYSNPLTTIECNTKLNYIPSGTCSRTINITQLMRLPSIDNELS